MTLGDVKICSARPEAKAYKLADGEGMILLVRPNGSKYRRLSYRFGGKEKILALRKYPRVSLVDARGCRDEARKLLANGVDPSENKKAVKIKHEQEVVTFEVVAREWHASNQKWSVSRSAHVLESLEDNLSAAIDKRNIADLKTRDLLAPIRAVESSGCLEVTVRLRQHTTTVVRSAVQSELIDYNPAQEIADVVATAKRQYYAALELNRVPELLRRIHHCSGRPLTRLTVELILLVFIRSGELRSAHRSEVDFGTVMWAIPGEREPPEEVKHSQRGSKIQTPHLVPLSRQALIILKKIRNMSGNRGLIFVGDHDPRKSMSESTLNKALRMVGYDTRTEVYGHDFRTMACGPLIESELWSRGK